MGSIIAVGLKSSLLLAQGGGAAGGGVDWLFANPIIPLGITMLFLYLLMFRPEQKKRKELEKQLAAVKKNDHVITIGGIYGTVVNAVAGSRFVTIRVDDGTGTKLKILRSAISQFGAVDEGDMDVKPGE
ncbi:MAG TPA: preprotein translocase subunit YajC [Pirellulaceae bacterium]